MTRPTIPVLVFALLAPLSAQEVPTQKPTSRPVSRIAKRVKKPGDKTRQGGYLGLYLSEKATGRRRGTITIDSVFPGSDAEKAGFEAGDVVVAVNGRDVRNGDQFIQYLWSQAMVGRRRGAPASRRKRAGEILVRRRGREVPIQAGLAELDRTPAVGQRAPDFTLSAPGGKKRRSLHSMLGRKPLVLIFGSYT